MSGSGIIGQAYGWKIHAREVVAIDEAGDGTGGRAVGSVPGGRAVSLLLYLALGALAVAVIVALSTDVRAAARSLFSHRRQ